MEKGIKRIYRVDLRHGVNRLRSGHRNKRACFRAFCYYYSCNMAVNTQFSIAVHILAGLECAKSRDITSSELASSVNTSASFVRRIVAKLSKAGLVETTTGKAGKCWLARKAKDISLLQIYQAVDAPRAFAIHTYKEQKACAVSCNIKGALQKSLTKTQRALEATLSDITLAQVVSDLN
jgi:Rrf2 family protein